MQKLCVAKNHKGKISALYRDAISITLLFGANFTETYPSEPPDPPSYEAPRPHTELPSHWKCSIAANGFRKGIIHSEYVFFNVCLEITKLHEALATDWSKKDFSFKKNNLKK